MKAYVIGTCDTKGRELAYVKGLIEARGVPAVLVDVGTGTGGPEPGVAVDVTGREVALHHPGGIDAVFSDDRGRAVGAMAEALRGFLGSRADVGGVIGLGGSGGTALVTPAMRDLPVGVPKVMVSTLASGNVAPYVGPADIMMMYSLTDVSGINRISRAVLGNAAHALAGMVAHPPPRSEADKPALGLTMFGVTTPCVQRAKQVLEAAGYEVLVFHATGSGGQSLEKLADSGFLDSIEMVAGSDFADYLVGGVLPCTADRFGAFIRHPIPYIGSVGACDMVNFGPRSTVPSRFAGRKFHVHNAHVTLMRTTPEENAILGKQIGEKLSRAKGPTTFMIPLKGVSAIDADGEPFHDPAADAALFDAIRQGWRKAKNHKLVELDLHINEPAFAAAAVAVYKSVAKLGRR